ncbi:MAG TPA: Dam family site-specific DNA-(adenine-N6)-methyltransferase [Armatimonadota bacterium]|nr:Dam family site-specific DNA-(adenine-N6)-methyltransferase [Armatimonadota bacterium]HPO73709.1 Dam family site-specific DNA-(adenine-N6)-methyltransferase [Armatimonadota bacterium]
MAGREPLPPPLKWAGGKRWLVPRLREIYASHRERRLVEPFAGGLAVALGLLPKRALLSDINPHVISFYQHLREGLVIDLPMENDASFYYAARERFNRLVAEGQAHTREAAALFYYLNRTGYNGLCRFNSRGGFNVPFGRYATINYRRDFREYAHVLASWEFRHGDFAGIVLREDDFVYADPPYDVQFTRYSKDDFSWDDQVRLARWLAAFDGPVVASNQATPRILELYQALGFKIELLPGPRRIACDGNRAPAVEMLAARNV